jgi:hypothetical protein
VSSDDNQAAHAAVSDLVQQIDPGSMVTRFILIAEVIGADNDRAVWSFVAPGAKKWDTLGLLDFGRLREYADPDTEP